MHTKRRLSQTSIHIGDGYGLKIMCIQKNAFKNSERERRRNSGYGLATVKGLGYHTSIVAEFTEEL
jgi:hypothetical protein